MKFASTLLAVVAVSASMVAAAPVAEPTVKADCNGPCWWKREAAPAPVAAPEPTVKADCNGPCWWKREAIPEPVVEVEERAVKTVKADCNGPCWWKRQFGFEA